MPAKFCCKYQFLEFRITSNPLRPANTALSDSSILHALPLISNTLSGDQE